MIGTTSDILTATWADAPRVGALMALAFASDPFVRWILPDPLAYTENSIHHPGRTAAPAFDDGTAYIFGDNLGAAVWLSPAAKLDRGVETGSTGFARPKGYSELIKRSEAYKPSKPHWYLAFIVVDPAHRGKGIGTMLMEHTLGIVDQDRLPAYLESTNEANLSLYERFGFEKLAKVTVDTSPARFPMIRKAR
jgi:ribosomal protein S18 acetylase RimI-like enzyme